MKRLLTYLLIVPILALTACEPAADDDLAMSDTDTLATQQADRYAQAELQSWLDDVDRNMEQLQARMQEVQNEDVDMEDLRQRRDEIRNDLQGNDTDTGAWTAMTSGDLQSRLRDLDADVEEARLKTIEQRDEFIAEVRTRLNEIDSDLEALNRRAGTTGTTTPGTTGDPGVTDGTAPGIAGQPDPDATADGTTGQRQDAYDGRTSPGTTGTYAANVDVEELRDERDDVAEELNEVEANAETDFESSRDSLAESVAELRARVQEANLELRSNDTSMGMQTSPNTASTN